MRQRTPDFLRQGVMPLAHDARRGHLGARLHRINGRVQAFTGTLAREHDRRGKMRKHVHRRRIGEVIGRHIHRLNGGDGAGIRVGDAFFQSGQFGSHRGLITQPRRHLPHQARHFRAGLDKPENIVDQQQHIAVLVVPEILGHRQGGMTHPEAAARRLIHLAEDHHHVGQHASVFHIAVKLLAFAAAFANAAKNADPFLVPHHVVNHFGEQHRFANPRTAKKPGLAAALQRHQHVDGLDAGLEDFRPGGAARQRRRRTVHRAPLKLRRRRLPVNGVAKHVKHAGKNPLAHGRHQRLTGVNHRHASGKALRRCQRNCAHMVCVTLRQHLKDDATLIRVQHGVNGRQMRIEAHVHNAATHGDNNAGVRIACFRPAFSHLFPVILQHER